MSQLFSYIVEHDIGFAPNPFHGYCTLACCKPRIRKMAESGDWVVGITSANHGEPRRFLYAMQIKKTLCFNKYWNDPIFKIKRPNFRGSKKMIFGDNIYHQDSNKENWQQEISRHRSRSQDIKEKNIAQKNLQRDTGTTTEVLISDNFAYWGSKAVPIPAFLRQSEVGGEDIVKKGRGHKSDFSAPFIQSFVDWFNTQEDRGFCGRPFDWSKSIFL